VYQRTEQEKGSGKMSQSRILVVEDELIIANNIQRALDSLGYRVCAHAETGEEALQKAKQEKPDLALMDIKIKGDMDGIETAEQIRTRLDIPVVYLTGLADEKTLARAKITEPFGYVIKPFKDRELHAALEMAIYKHQMEKERARLIHELQTALAKVKTLSGLLPICASCKKIRDDEGYWHRVEVYIRDHTEAEFTHGLCPECAKDLYPEFS
jgi:CheY-like chemotaxis protein